MGLNFYTDVIVPDPRFESLAQVRDPMLLEPVTRAARAAIFAEAAKDGYLFVGTETYRSQALQTYDFNHGLTQLERAGVHHYGLAFDFAWIVDGEAYWGSRWDYSFGLYLSNLATKNRLISGFNWGKHYKHRGFHDMPHFQRIRVEDQSKLFSGQWYPEADYSPYSRPAFSVT